MRKYRSMWIVEKTKQDQQDQYIKYTRFVRGNADREKTTSGEVVENPLWSDWVQEQSQ